MKTLIKTKLLEGKYVETRDYEMFKEDLRIIHCESKDYKNCTHESEQFMFLSIAKQKKGKVVNKLQSKFPPYSYYLMYKFLWKPYVNLDRQVPIYKALDKMVGTPAWEELRKKLHK